MLPVPCFKGADFKSDVAFKTLIPNAQIWAKKYQLSNIIKILQVAYFDGAYFKSVICFQKF